MGENFSKEQIGGRVNDKRERKNRRYQKESGKGKGGSEEI